MVMIFFVRVITLSSMKVNWMTLTNYDQRFQSNSLIYIRAMHIGKACGPDGLSWTLAVCTPKPRSVISAGVCSRWFWCRFYCAYIMYKSCNLNDIHNFRPISPLLSQFSTFWGMWFLLRDDMRKHSLCCCSVSIRPSVCHFLYCIQMAEYVVKFLSRPGSPIMLVFLCQPPVPNSRGNPLSLGVK